VLVFEDAEMPAADQSLAKASEPMDAALEARMEQLPTLVNGNSDLVRRGAWVDVQFQIGLGAVSYYVTVAAGRVVALERGPLLMRSSRFSIQATIEAWAKFWAPVPEPGWHDLLALTKRGAARFEGDLHPLIANLQYFKDVLAAPRRPAGETR
jgi:hypothetical protein